MGELHSIFLIFMQRMDYKRQRGFKFCSQNNKISKVILANSNSPGMMFSTVQHVQLGGFVYVYECPFDVFLLKLFTKSVIKPNDSI